MSALPTGLALAVGCFLLVGSSGGHPVAAPGLGEPTPPTHRPPATRPNRAEPDTARFLTSDRCLACHKGVTTSRGEEVSIGFDWRATMMANSARDPYWQAAVRRETIDHPQATELIEDECGTCHMPMARTRAAMAGMPGEVFANLPVGASEAPGSALAADGVSCATCHQIRPSGLGDEASFGGGFHIAPEVPPGGRPMFGPFEPDPSGVGIMHSATGFLPAEGSHIQSSELCATCHTLVTRAVRAGGAEGPPFPEQMPYLEWRASAYAARGTSCQDCHMPEVVEDVPVTSVLGRPRPNVSRHVFLGGNFFVTRMLDRYRAELGVTALPQELALAAERIEDHLRDATASVAVTRAAIRDGRLEAEVEVRNRTGHKFPTAYPSRRAWLHVTVSDRDGRPVFESGAFSPDGQVVGDDQDAGGGAYEPHWREISRPDQVQVYEAVMRGADGAPTTGLLSAEGWLKDNRLLPLGHDATADARIAPVGRVGDDPDFFAGQDRVRYSIEVDPARGPFALAVELWFQPIGYRWAHNLGAYDAMETRRFVRYYEDMAEGSAIVIAGQSMVVR